MKFILIALALAVINSNNCKGKKRVPDSVQKRIEQIKLQPRWNPPAEVNEYTYQGKRVFLFTSDCCDRYIELYDDQCQYLCAPSGGFTGKGDNKCERFYQEATHVRLVWKDDRN